MFFDKYSTEQNFIPYINTGTLYDYATGKFKAGTDGKWVLDGGLSQCVGISGRGQTYKSGIAGSLMANAMLTHPNAHSFVYETEGTVGSSLRYDDFVPVDKPVSDRIHFTSSTEMNLSDYYDQLQEIISDKLKEKKEWIVESPFMNPATGKPYKVWTPTFVLIDSFSRARSGKSETQYEENSVDASALNQSFMLDGNIKTRIMSDLPTRAAKAGVYVIMTAHVGNKIDMNAYAPTPKQLQYMKNTDKMKNVGSNFEFLTTTLIQTLKASVLQNSNKQCEYPATRGSTPIEVNQVDTMMVRCKNNASGGLLPIVVSQYQGILNSVTNFNFLRNNKDFGLDIQGNKQGFSPMIYPEHYTRKTTIRSDTDKDYKLNRALELTAQLCFIQNLWSTMRMPDYITTPPEKLAELLKNSQNCSVERVLESTGVWSTAQQDRERMTLMDVLAFLSAEKKI